MFIWKLLKHPDWDWFSFWDKFAYVISLACFLGLMSLGARSVFHWGVHH